MARELADTLEHTLTAMAAGRCQATLPRGPMFIVEGNDIQTAVNHAARYDDDPQQQSKFALSLSQYWKEILLLPFSPPRDDMLPAVLALTHAGCFQFADVNRHLSPRVGAQGIHHGAAEGSQKGSQSR